MTPDLLLFRTGCPMTPTVRLSDTTYTRCSIRLSSGSSISLSPLDGRPWHLTLRGTPCPIQPCPSITQESLSGLLMVLVMSPTFTSPQIPQSSSVKSAWIPECPVETWAGIFWSSGMHRFFSFLCSCYCFLRIHLFQVCQISATCLSLSAMCKFS